MSSLSIWIGHWNRKIHIYLGLFLMLFLWVFAVSGLFMNHPGWFSHGRPRDLGVKPIQETSETIQLQAEALARQLGLHGEIVLGPRPPEPGRLMFRVLRLGGVVTVLADLENEQATLRVNRHTLPGMLENLHTFTGVRRAWNEPAEPVRDWWIVRLWSFSIDAIALGFGLMAVTSIYMWYQLKKKRRLGLVILALGILSCSFFMWGFQWLF